MSNPTSDGHAADLARWLPLGTATGLALLLLICIVSMFLVISLMGDVAALQDQAKKTAKATKAMQEDVAALREQVQGAAPKRVAEVAGADPVPTNIDAADPGRDCVIRSGDKNGLTNCIAPTAKP